MSRRVTLWIEWAVVLLVLALVIWVRPQSWWIVTLIFFSSLAGSYVIKRLRHS